VASRESVPGIDPIPVATAGYGHVNPSFTLAALLVGASRHSPCVSG